MHPGLPRDTPEPPRFDERPVVVLSARRDTGEIEGLVDAVGFHVVDIVRQPRPRPDPATFIGRGRLEELGERLKEQGRPLVSDGTPLVVVNAELKPSTVFNLEDELDVEVWDRVRLILEIFQRNARVREARLQVELARLRYELPFVHEALHRRMTGERAGFMGGGEVEIRTYETHLKRRTKTILQELEKVKRERETRRAGRRRGGMRLVAITGYTNSGKSTLLNALTEGEAISRNQLFSTLQTTTRRMRSKYHPGRPSDIVLTDTVGFIQNLPPWLIDAFSSTLEEISESDAVVLVVDASEAAPIVEQKATAALDVLKRIHAPPRMVVLLNKADLVPEEQRPNLRERLALKVLPPEVPAIYTSLKTAEGLEKLAQTLRTQVLETREAFVQLDPTHAAHVRFESWLRDRTDILEQEEVSSTHRRMRIRCPIESWGILLSRATKEGVPVRTDSTGNKGGPLS